MTSPRPANVRSSAPRAPGPRICMPTVAGFARNTFRTGLYEAQDVLASCADVERIPLEPAPGFAFRQHWLMRLVYHDVSRSLVFRNPGLRPLRLTKEYDVFLVVCPYWRDVWYANAIQGWRDHCRTSICWVDELWAGDLSQLRYWLPVLSRFDHVIVGVAGSAKAVSEALGRPCHEMAGGVDAIRFSPYPSPPERVIDVYSIGRRQEAVHRSLRALAARDLFYVHDTLADVGNSETPDHAQHRDMYAGMAKRSRFFVVAPGKMNAPETRGQAALGFRYFEGSAAGAVLIGQAPDSEQFRRHFDWPQAVVEIAPDGSDTAEVISKLSASPGLVRELGRRNAEESLRRHDWVYRWREVFELAGLDPTPAMTAREKRLGELADLASDPWRIGRERWQGAQPRRA